eukprot:scaffold303805_cov24-Attheya_sp.AAC.1
MGDLWYPWLAARSWLGMMLGTLAKLVGILDGALLVDRAAELLGILELGALAGSADKIVLGMLDGKLDGAALVDGETDGTELGGSEGKLDGR